MVYNLYVLYVKFNNLLKKGKHLKKRKNKFLIIYKLFPKKFLLIIYKLFPKKFLLI